MANTQKFEPTFPLSPSELVLLNGEHFDQKVIIGNIQLMQSEASVSFSQLGESILAAAVLAVRSTGNLDLDTRLEKSMFGLRKVKSLYAESTTITNSWPD